MKSFFKFVLILLVISAIAAVVASIVSKKKLESMSDDEIREYLGLKLAGRVGEDQLVTIQDAVVSGVRGKRAATDHYIEDVEEAMDDLDHVAEEAELEAIEDTIESVQEVAAE
jgi:hypothetical protein